MAGTSEGNKKTAKRVKELYGEDFYKKIGKKGKELSSKSGFATMDKAKHRAASSKGGKKAAEVKKSRNKDSV